MDELISKINIIGSQLDSIYLDYININKTCDHYYNKYINYLNKGNIEKYNQYKLLFDEANTRRTNIMNNINIKNFIL